VTTSDERIRSLRWGHEWLLEATSTAGTEIAAMAAELLRSYPKDHPTDLEDLSAGQLEAVKELPDLLAVCAATEQFDPALKRQITYVLRHYPSPYVLNSHLQRPFLGRD